MEDTTPAFDAADLADAILGTTETTETETVVPLVPSPRPRSSLGWVLLFALLLAVGAAFGLALQETEAAPNPTPCDGLFPADCCVQWDNDWDEPRGLFDDAETEFTDCDES